MLARAAGRKLRREASRTPTIPRSQLTLPRQSHRTWHTAANAANANAGAPTQHSRSHRRPSLSPRTETRSLATATELQPTPTSPAFNPFSHTWSPQIQSPELAQVPLWNPSSPLVVHDALANAPYIRGAPGLGSDHTELRQNLYACLRVGRLERAAALLDRFRVLFVPSAPEVVDAHNVYLQALLEAGQEDPKDDSLANVEHWYTRRMSARGVPPNAQTFVTLIRSAMNFLDDGSQDDKIRNYLATAYEYGAHVVDDINASPEFTDEEWDYLIRLQPEEYSEPPSIQQVQHLHVSTPDARKNLIEHGLVSYPAQTIRAVPQKGLGLDSLKEALTVLDTHESVPYPHGVEGTPAEKDQAYAYTRQIRMEQDSADAAVKRWKQEEEKLNEIGIHAAMKTKPIQAVLYNWYNALVPLFKQRIEQAKKILSEPVKENANHEAHACGPWLERCRPEKLAALTAARAVQTCVRNKDDDGTSLKVSSLSISIGTDVEDYLNADARSRRDTFLKKQRRQTRKGLVSKLAKTDITSRQLPEPRIVAPGLERTDIPLANRTRLGAMCLELLLQCATIKVTVDDPRTGKTLTRSMAAFHHQIGFTRGKKTGYIVPHHEFYAMLRTDGVQNIHTLKLPMIVEPKPWSSYVDGGYYTTPQKVVRQKAGDNAQRVYAESAIEAGDMDQILAGLDVLGKVPWQINAPVFHVMAQAWNAGETLGGLVGQNIDLERPQEPSADSTYQERAKWGQALRAYDNFVGGLHSQRCFQNLQLETARAFLDEKHIYFPHSVDFRGRAYPIPPVLNHIGSDVPRGLLKFANGKELGTVGLQWLKIHLANLFGYDKASLHEREQFAMDHINEIYDSANNALDGRRWWTKAEDPWQCLACCMELKNAFDSPDPTRFVSQLPVHQDGTCNGLQHYAALGGDHAGARQVNLEPSDRPQDIYTGVAELVRGMVAKDAAKKIPLACFIDGHITRKVVKRTVMTNVYGVTFIGAKQQVQGELETMFPKFQPTEQVRTLGAVALYVALKIFEALGQIFNGAQEIQYWLGECGDRITTSISSEQVKAIYERYKGSTELFLDPKYATGKKVTTSIMKKRDKVMQTFKTSIVWTTPLKMPIVQPYRKDSVQVVRTKVQDITVSKRSQSDAIDKRKQLQAFPPNFIHSLDASHMILSALKASEIGLDFAAVHDSFWTHACDIPNLNVVLRDAFVRMHSEDVVGRLAAEFAARYAGAMHRASIGSQSTAGTLIRKWRVTRHKDTTAQSMRKAHVRTADATFDEIALEAQRQELLKSEDAKERKQGEEMVTPTSIWLAHEDPTALNSFRLNLMGETRDRKAANKRQSEIRENMLGAVTDVPDSNVTEAASDEAATADEKLASEAEDAEAEAQTEEGDVEDASLAKKKSPSRLAADKSSIQVWIPLTFPAVPKKGDWDISRLRTSQYFFS